MRQGEVPFISRRGAPKTGDVAKLVLFGGGRVMQMMQVV